MNIKKSFFALGFITLFTRLLGGVRDIVRLKYIGINADTDSFLIARRLQALFVRIFGEGAMQNAITPYLIDYEQYGKQRACKLFVSRVFTIVLMITLAIAVLVNVYAHKFVSCIAPGLACNSERMSITVKYLRIINPSIILVSLSSVYFAVIAARQKFTLVSLCGAIVNCVLLSFMVLGKCTMALVVGYLVVCFIQYIYCYCCAMYYKCSMPVVTMPRVSLYMSRMLKKMLPTIIGTSVIQFDVFASTIFASYLPEKSITYISYCDQIVQVPISMIGTSLATILLPYVASVCGSSKNGSEKHFNMIDVLNLSLRLSLPIAIAMFFFSYTVIEFVGRGSGKITSDDILITSQLISVISLMIPFSVMSKIMASISLAQKKTVIPMFASIATVLANISVCTFFIKYGTFNVYISILALVLSMVCNVCVYLYSQRSLLSDVSSMLRILFSAAVMSITLYLCLGDQIWTASIVRSIVFGSVGMLVYFSCLVITGDISVSRLKSYFAAKKN